MSDEGDESDGDAAQQDRGGEGRGGFSVVVPPPRGGGAAGGSEVRWWLKAGVLALLFLLPFVIYGAWTVGWIDLRMVPDLGGLLGSGPAAAPDTAAAVRAAPADAGARFRRRADSLSEAVSQYGERRSAYAEGAIQCGPLQESFERLQRHFEQLSVLYRSEQDELGSERTLRYESLVTAVDSAGAHFGRSDCADEGGQAGEAAGPGGGAPAAEAGPDTADA